MWIYLKRLLEDYSSGFTETTAIPFTESKTYRGTTSPVTDFTTNLLIDSSNDTRAAADFNCKKSFF